MAEIKRDGFIFCGWCEGAGVELDEQITTLREQLKRHGGHTADCRIGVVVGPDFATAKCDCGWVDIERLREE